MPLVFVPQPYRATTAIPAIIVGTRDTSRGSAHIQSSTTPTFRKLLQLNSKTRTRIRATIRMPRRARLTRKLGVFSTRKLEEFLRESPSWWVCFLLQITPQLWFLILVHHIHSSIEHLSWNIKFELGKQENFFIQSLGGRLCTKEMVHQVPIELGGHIFPTSMIILKDQDIDVILDMNWMY
jgi:hypothetical protein